MDVTTEGVGSSTYAPRMPRAQRREAILDAALEAFAEGGVAAVNMEEVARRAGVAKPVVYRQFSNADEVMRELLVRESGRALEVAGAFVPSTEDYADPLTATSAALVTALDEVRANPGRWRLLLARGAWHDSETRELYAQARRFAVARLAHLADLAFAARAGGELDPELTAHLIVAGLEEGAQLVLDAPDHFPPERITRFVNELVRTILQG